MNIDKNLLETKNILVVGDVILDKYLYGNVERISPEAPVPVLDIDKIEQRLGGAANVALNCKSLGCNVDLISVTGNDPDGLSLIKQLKLEKINCFVESNKDYNTIKKTRLISNAQQILRMDEEKKPAQLTKKAHLIFLKKIEKADIIIFSDYGKGILNNLPDLINEVKAVNKVCLVDPKGINPQKFKGCHVLTPNFKEMTNLIGNFYNEHDFKEKTFQMMKKNKINNIVVTRGNKGLTLYQLKNFLEFNIKDTPSEIFDVTGAGDTVISVLSVLLSLNYSLKDACIVANKAGGIVVQKFGTTSIAFEEIF